MYAVSACLPTRWFIVRVFRRFVLGLRWRWHHRTRSFFVVAFVGCGCCWLCIVCYSLSLVGYSWLARLVCRRPGTSSRPANFWCCLSNKSSTAARAARAAVACQRAPLTGAAETVHTHSRTNTHKHTTH